MAPFRYGEDDLQHPLDWTLLENGPVTLYRRRSFLDDDLDELARLGYEIHRFDAPQVNLGRWNESFKRELPGFAEYCGDNFNALRDCLQDLTIAEGGGMAIVFDNFEDVDDPDNVLLDAFAEASRRWSLFGRRLIVLVQVDDPAYEGPPNLGATPAQWNGHEWMTADRYLPSELPDPDTRH